MVGDSTPSRKTSGEGWEGVGAAESPILLSVTFKDAKTFDMQNPVTGNLLRQVDTNKTSDAKVKQLLGQAKDDEIQARLNRLRKRIDKSDDNNNNNTNFDDSSVDDDNDDDDNDGNNVGGNELLRRCNNLRRPTTIPNNNDEEELLRRYNNLKAPPKSEEELLRRYNDLRTLFFRGIPPSPPLSLKKPGIEKEHDDIFLIPPQSPTVDALKTDFDRPITKIIP